MEIWKEVYNYDVLFEVSNLGRVRTKYQKNKGYTSEHVYLKPYDNGNGYLRFNWRVNGKQKTVYLHKLVALYFLDNDKNYCEVNHKDENKKNNCVDNLEWCDHKYNCNYGTRNKRMSEKKTKKIKCIDTGIIYSSLKEASESMNVRISAIGNCLKGRSKTCCGVRWEYI